MAPDKETFYYEKLQELFTNKRVSKLLEKKHYQAFSKKSTRKNSYNQRKKRCSNITSLFLNNLKADLKAKEIIHNSEKNFAQGLDALARDLENQKTSFKEKVKTKRKSNQEQSLEGSETLVEDLFRKLHTGYLHKIIEFSTNSTIECLNLQYTNRVELFSSYQDEIKNFEIVKVMTEGSNHIY